MVVEIRFSLVEGGTRSRGVENGEKEENPHYLAFWVPRWFSVQTFSPCSVLFFFFNIYVFIWLCQFLVTACKPLVEACGIQSPYQGWNSGPLHWEHGVLATGLPGKSLNSVF